MRQYGLLKATYLSFYSKSLYKDVATNWGGYAFLYLLMLLALSMIYWTVQAQQAINAVYINVSDQFVAQTPVLTVKDGKISTPEKRPYLIKDTSNKKTIAVIDTTGKYKTLEDAKTQLLIKQDEIIYSSKPNETRIDKVPNNISLVFDPVVVNGYIKKGFSYAWMILYPLFILGAFFYRVIQALIYAVIGRIFGAIIGAGISYAQALQISLVAITPVIVLLTITDAFNVSIAHCILSCFVLATAYLFYGVWANKH